MTTITIEWEDGSAAMITEQEFIEACLETLQQLRKNKRKTDSPASAPLKSEGNGKSGVRPQGQFFRRAIVTRQDCADGSEEVTLECGHHATWIIPVPGDFMNCAQCVNEWVDRARSRAAVSTADLRSIQDEAKRAKACQSQVDIQGGEL